ncbi:MAG: hypothetical protein AAF799_16810 [Myxococcota bacterium]
MWSAVDRWLGPPAPASRLAAVRVAVVAFALAWTAGIASELLTRAQLDPSRFAPVGLAGLFGVVPPALVTTALVVVFGLGILALVGRGYRWSAPAFALTLTWLLSYRNSWGHMSHSEHLLVLHLWVLAFAPAADALRLRSTAPATAPSGRYGWPQRLLMVVTVSTYVIAGLAKLRGGGSWISGETVRLHVATEVLRNDMIGTDAALIGRPLLPFAGLFGAFAIFTLVVELGAPLAVAAGRIRLAWVAAVWSMHLGIGLVMGIGFAYPLSGVAFAAFVPLERLVDWLTRLRQRRPA